MRRLPAFRLNYPPNRLQYIMPISGHLARDGSRPYFPLVLPAGEADPYRVERHWAGPEIPRRGYGGRDQRGCGVYYGLWIAEVP